MRISIAALLQSAREFGTMLVPYTPRSLLIALPLLFLHGAVRPAAGDALFGTPIPFELAPISDEDLAKGATPPRGIAIGDLNGDGNPDLVVPNYTTAHNVSVVLGNGDGTFGPRNDYGAGMGNVSVAIADLDLDGQLDVVATDEGGKVWILRGRGDGTLGAATGIPVANGIVAHVKVGDLNGDRKPDLVTATFDGPVSVLLGNGDGTFAPDVDYPGVGGLCVAIGDLNGDGNPDLATPAYPCCFPGANTVLVLLGNGDGTFRPGQSFAAGGSLAGLQSVSIADLDSDGNPDMVVGDVGHICVLMGDGAGGFPKLATFLAHHGDGPWPYQGQEVGVGDLNGDGKPDIVVADEWDPSPPSAPGLLVFLGNGDGTFCENLVYGARSSYAVAIGDVNGDAKADLVSVGEVLLNTGPDPIKLDLEVHPSEVDLGSDREWITATIELPRPYRVSEIDVSSIRLNGAVRPSRSSIDDGELTLKFAWADVRETLVPGRRVPVTLVAAMGGDRLRGADWIRVKGKIHRPGSDQGGDPLATGTFAGTALRDPRAAAGADAAAAFALQPQNPARGRIDVRFLLAGPEPATLDVFDVSGRRMMSREVASGSAGWHTVGLGEAAPGLYHIRLSQAGRSLTSRVAVIR
jgi:hypothetical protein